MNHDFVDITKFLNILKRHQQIDADSVISKSLPSVDLSTRTLSISFEESEFRTVSRKSNDP